MIILSINKGLVAIRGEFFVFKFLMGEVAAFFGEGGGGNSKLISKQKAKGRQSARTILQKIHEEKY